MRKFLALVATWFALCGSVVVAQQILPGFPPGTFSNKAALDPSGAPPAYTGPLDVIASPVVWYGLQCAATAYTGNMADVWDTSTGSTTETLLTCSSGGVINQTVHSLSVTCAVSCNIKTLYDQSGGSNCTGACDLTQATNASRPLLNQSALSGKLLVNCTGTSSMTAIASLSGTIAGNVTWSTVAERTGSFTSYAAILNVTPLNSSGMFWNDTANNIAMYNGSNQVLTATANDNAFHAAQMWMALGASQGTFYVDGTSTGPEANLASTAIGGAAPTMCTNPSGQAMTGYIGEAGYWGANESSNFSAINSNQHSRWGF